MPWPLVQGDGASKIFPIFFQRRNGVNPLKWPQVNAVALSMNKDHSCAGPQDIFLIGQSFAKMDL